VCFVGPRALLVDWATAGRHNRWIDVAFALLNYEWVRQTIPRAILLGETYAAELRTPASTD
jgi:hypothetical protein